MAIRSDSYSSMAEVVAYTRHLLDGSPVQFNKETRPTDTEVEKFIDRASGVLNNAILAAGFTPATVAANSTAVLALDDWVTNRASMMIEMTQRGRGFSGEEGSRIEWFKKMLDEANDYVTSLAAGWRLQGISVTKPAHLGLTFTGLDDYDERADPDDTTLAQPKFRRGQFDNT